MHSFIHLSLKQPQACLPGLVDKKGRPAIVCRARNHDPNADYVETLSMLVYLTEMALSYD